MDASLFVFTSVADRIWTSVIFDSVDVRLPANATQPTRALVRGIFLRSISLDGIRRLIGLGADVNVLVALTCSCRIQHVGILSLAIDTSSIFPPLKSASPVWRWRTREVQAAILNELILAGASVNGGNDHTIVPIKMAKESLNMTAVEVLLSHHVAVRGHPSLASSPLLFIDRLGQPLAGYFSAEKQDVLFNISARLLQHDPSLATDMDIDGKTTVMSVCRVAFISISQIWIDQYLAMLVERGASLTQRQQGGGGGEATPLTPLQCAAWASNHTALTYLLGRIPSTEVNRRFLHVGGVRTALYWAASGLKSKLTRYHGKSVGVRLTMWTMLPNRVDEAKRCIRTLLRHGGSIDLLPSHTQETQHKRSLVLEEYAAILNELPQRVMIAINAALKRQRDTAVRVGCLLPMAPHHDGAYPHPSPSSLTFGPQEAISIAWKIGAFLHDPSAARAVVDEFLIADSPLKRRVGAAVDHVINQAATKTVSNREVVGKTAMGKGRTGEGLLQWLKSVVNVTGGEQGGPTMGEPPLQCFAIKGGEDGQHRRLGVREVVHRARLDEAAVYGLEGSIIKGFNSHLGNTDCDFRWGQLGYVDKDGHFVSLGIN
ncbi:unnamed protein product [Vitrella brassicaformis CCMP3155]|uniref:Uncharacterized protein n=1 Tax=Vitrella brassicaformis (strain CCMP3155) TaxID=1169540 RepID=A0A0G4EVD2_VITBC|nr:unnamed protein product [Vitrella brassicaformis CCMP3155]|eukprot:CEM02025.1 unnamed protein product [Vitrella brassicaformis CCMP3155]